MPNVRHTPKRRRTTCPACQKDVAYTIPWVFDGNPFDTAGLSRSRFAVTLSKHNTSPGVPCAKSGAEVPFDHRRSQ